MNTIEFLVFIIMLLIFVRYFIAIKRIKYYIKESQISYDEKGNLIKREFVLQDGFRYVHSGNINTFPPNLIKEHGLIVKTFIYVN